MADMNCFENMSLIISTPRVHCKVNIQVVAEVEPDLMGLQFTRGDPMSPLKTV